MKLLVYFTDGKRGSMTLDRYAVGDGILYAYMGRNFVGFPLTSVHHWTVVVTPSEHGPGFVVES